LLRHSITYTATLNLGKFQILANNVALYDDQAMKLLATEMYGNQKQFAWSLIELYNACLGYGGQLIRKHMCTKLVTSLGTVKLTKLEFLDEKKDDEKIKQRHTAF